MFMASSWTGSWPLGVILTFRREVFICGETDVMVPCTMVPAPGVIVSMRFLFFFFFFFPPSHPQPGGKMQVCLPFLSSIVTVSLAHFIKNLTCIHD